MYAVMQQYMMKNVANNIYKVNSGIFPGFQECQS